MKTKTIIATLLGILALFIITIILINVTGISLFKNKTSEIVLKQSWEYADLEAISKYQTPNIGDNSKVENIIKYLPQLSNFYKQNMFSLQTTNKPYGLTIYYERISDDNNSAQNPFLQSCAENNALILFSFIDNLDTISYAFRETPSQGKLSKDEYKINYTYKRSDFQNKYEDISLLKNDLYKLDKILLDNFKISDGILHFNRITLGSDKEHIKYRNGEPTHILKSQGGSTIWVYENLGQVEYSPLSNPDEKTIVPGSGVNAEIYLNSIETIEKEGWHGVYKINIYGTNSEILYCLNIVQGTKEEILQKLKKPTIELTREDNSTYMAYQLKDSKYHYVYFVLKDNKIVEHGLTVDYTDYSKIDAIKSSMTNPEQVALHFIINDLKINGEIISITGKEFKRVEFKKEDGNNITIDLYQPYEKGAAGIWEVDCWYDTNNKKHQVRDLSKLQPLFHHENVIPNVYKETIKNAIEKTFTEGYNKYYQVLGFESTNVKYNQTDKSIEITCNLTMITKNFYKDPDTVGYIKQAKQNNSKDYQTLYDEYNSEKQSNFEIKITAQITENNNIDTNTIKIYGNTNPKGYTYIPIEDFFPKKAS